MYIGEFPASNDDIMPIPELAEKLIPLIGTQLEKTGLDRTDGANLRKMFTQFLGYKEGKGNTKQKVTYYTKKGIPKLKRLWADTFKVYTDANYNLQVWNRNPDGDRPLVNVDGNDLFEGDVRHIITHRNEATGTLDCILILDGPQIVHHFGKFSVPTIKHQVIISGSKRNQILLMPGSTLIELDNIADNNLQDVMNCIKNNPNPALFKSDPESQCLFSISQLDHLLREKLIGRQLEYQGMKNAGQTLELIVMQELGYNVNEGELLEGSYPDLRHQLLEIKVQESPTIDMGMHSPLIKEEIVGGLDTQDVRYLIALMSPEKVVQGLVIVPGSSLEHHFSYVKDTSFKRQKSISIDLFKNNKGRVLFDEGGQLVYISA